VKSAGIGKRTNATDFQPDATDCILKERHHNQNALGNSRGGGEEHGVQIPRDRSSKVVSGCYNAMVTHSAIEQVRVWCSGRVPSVAGDVCRLSVRLAML
jgi:hypothetical protein